MAERDETSARRKRICTGGTDQKIQSAPQSNCSLGWFLEQEHRYPVRRGNAFTPYYSGQDAFTAVASSIENAQKSVDMIMWGFDPAMPIKRSAAYQNDYDIYETNLILPDKTYHHSFWRESDSIGQLILNALEKNQDLKIRLVIWYHAFSVRLMQNVVGVDGAIMESECPRDEVNTGFNPARLQDPSRWGADPGMTRLALRDRHPDAAKYSSAWFRKVRWEQFPGRDRLAVTFRDFKGMPAVNQALENRFTLFSTDMFMRMNDLRKTIGAHLPSLNRDKIIPLIGRSTKEISTSIDDAMESAKDKVGLTDALVGLKQEYIALVESYNNFVLDNLGEGADQVNVEVNSKLGVQEEDVNLGRSLYYSYKERVTLLSPTDHQKTILVDYEDDANRHGYIMGHNTLTKYWSRFPFVHRDKMNEMDYTPLHDFSMRVEGPLLIDINRNFCQAWEMNRIKGLSDFTAREISPPAGSQNVAPSALEKENPGQLLQSREPLEASILAQLKGNANGQIVRTRPDQKFPDGAQEKEVKDAYLQVVRHASNYIFIVNQYCQYPKLVRHLKYWRKQRRNEGHTGTLYILIGTCKPEQDGQVFAAQQMANELGVGVQFTKAHGELYDKNDILDDEGHRNWTFGGYNAQAASHVTPEDVSALDIKVLFFMFHTQIPVSPRLESGKPLREDVVAQQPYVHAKLMVQDDIFFTLGSSNLNIRSMAVDSEINLISDDYTTAQKMRHKLFGDYAGQQTSANFPNQLYSTEQGVNAQAMQRDMAIVFKEFSGLAKRNSEKVKEGRRIQGCISSFEDDRTALGAWVG